jgi:hypothetical protein
MKLSRRGLISFYAVLALTWLAGCGGSSSTPNTPPPPTIGKLYVTLTNGTQILRFNAGASGNASPQARTGIALRAPALVALDVPHDRMAVVSADVSPAIALVDNVSSGGSFPRIIAGPATTLGAPDDCALDGTNDLLYVGENLGLGVTAVLVFGPASTVTGNVAPLRTFTALNGGDMVLDAANNRLFLSDMVNNAILIFDGASTLSGRVVPNRVISGAATQLNGPREMVLDGSGRLIVSNPSVLSNPRFSNLLVFSNAGAANGNVAPATSSVIDRIPTQMAISPAGELYMTDGNAEVPIYGNIATASGSINPIRVIAGPDTGLNFISPGTFSLPQGIALDPTR